MPVSLLLGKARCKKWGVAHVGSFFSWLDYSDRERRRVLDVVRSLSERDTRDELGLATVRDALSDLLAPGISTIQTRARYFLFIPWLYQALEARLRRKSGTVSKDWVARQARKAEISLIEPLTESEDSEGTIGREAGKSLQRLPSSVYWNGLAEWRIRLCPWTIDQYHHRLAVSGPPARPAGDDKPHALPNWHAGLPDPPLDFPDTATMALRFEDAEYLRERILQKHSGSLLGQLVLTEQDLSEARVPWEILDRGIGLPPDIANVVRHAREFSLAMHGVVLIYNLMLAEAPSQPRDEWVGRYRSLLEDWAAEVDRHSQAFAVWNRRDFWRTVHRTRPQVPTTSHNFIDAWLDRLFAADRPLQLADDPSVRNLIANRERQLKKAQARLHNPRQLELWNGDAGSGTARMSYRWSYMRSHLDDIHTGLKRSRPEARGA